MCVSFDRSPFATPENVNDTDGWTTDISTVQRLLSKQLKDLMASQGPLPLLRRYYQAAISYKPPEQPPPPPATGPTDVNAKKPEDTLSGAVLAAVIVPIVVAFVGGFVLLKTLYALQAARKRSLTGKVRAQSPAYECLYLYL